MPVDLLGAHNARRGLGGEAVISLGVAVEQRGVGDGIGDTDAVVGAGNRREVRARGEGVHAASAIRGRAQAIARRALLIEIGRRLAGHG